MEDFPQTDTCNLFTSKNCGRYVEGWYDFVWKHIMRSIYWYDLFSDKKDDKKDKKDKDKKDDKTSKLNNTWP